MPEIPKPMQGPLAPRPVPPVPPLPIKTDPQLAASEAPTLPTPEELGVTTSKMPAPWIMGTMGSALGGAAAGPLGGGYGHYGAGGLLGTAGGLLLSRLLPGQITRGPISSQAEAVLARSPTIAAGILRAVYGGGAAHGDQRG